MSIRVLVVDDQADIRVLLSEFLEDEGYTVYVAGDSEEALRLVERHRPQIVLLDIWLNDKRFDGIAILDIIQRKHPEIVTIMMSGHGTIETAVSTLKKGAFDFIEKPFQSEKLSSLLSKAEQMVKLAEEIESLRSKVVSDIKIIGTTKQMENVRKEVDATAKGQSRVMIIGESGTGKTHIAEYIHYHSPRSHKPFVTVDCSSLTEKTFAEEFYGSESKDSNQYPVVKVGILERANGGTILLENIGDLPKALHPLMVSLLQSSKFSRVDGNTQITVDVRILSTLLIPKGEPYSDAYRGGLREDLFHRLAITKIILPNLRDHIEDVAILADFFLSKLSAKKKKITISPEVRYQFLKCLWPGNVRQLNNILEAALIKMADTDLEIKSTHLPADLNQHEAKSGEPTLEEFFNGSIKEARDKFERAYLLFQLKCNHNNIKKTADIIGMERTALHRKLKSLDIILDQEEGK